MLLLKTKNEYNEPNTTRHKHQITEKFGGLLRVGDVVVYAGDFKSNTWSTSFEFTHVEGKRVLLFRSI